MKSIHNAEKMRGAKWRPNPTPAVYQTFFVSGVSANYGQLLPIIYWFMKARSWQFFKSKQDIKKKYSQWKSIILIFSCNHSDNSDSSMESGFTCSLQRSEMASQSSSSFVRKKNCTVGNNSPGTAAFDSHGWRNPKFIAFYGSRKKSDLLVWLYKIVRVKILQDTNLNQCHNFKAESMI